MTDKAGLAGIWEDFNDFLKVDVETYEDEPLKGNSPVLIKFTVTNIAPAQHDRPEIYFEEVNLRVGVPPQWHTETSKGLGAGQSFTYQHRCSCAELTNVQWNIEARVSPKALLEVRRRSSGITPGTKPRLTAAAYLGLLSETNVHRWLKDVILHLTEPGPDTTLADVKAREGTLQEAAREIRDAEERLQRISGFIKAEHRDGISQHRKLVKGYLDRTVEGCGELERSLRRLEPRDSASARDGVVSRLTLQANQLDEATEELLTRYSVSKVSK